MLATRNRITNRVKKELQIDLYYICICVCCCLYGERVTKEAKRKKNEHAAMATVILDCFCWLNELTGDAGGFSYTCMCVCLGRGGRLLFWPVVDATVRIDDTKESINKNIMYQYVLLVKQKWKLMCLKFFVVRKKVAVVAATRTATAAAAIITWLRIIL